MTELDEQIKAEVLAGIDFLNEMLGPEWVDHIDPSTLSLASVHACVLGQCFKEPAKRHGKSGYFYAVETYSETHNDQDTRWAKEHGFYTDGDYDELTEAWRIVVSA